MDRQGLILVAAMGWGGQAPLLAELARDLDARGLSTLVWPIGGGDGGVGALRRAGLWAASPLRDYSAVRHLDDLALGGPALYADDPLLDYYHAFAYRLDKNGSLGPAGRLLLARWGHRILDRARETLDRLRPRALLVQSGLRMLEGALVRAAHEAGLPLLHFEKGVFAGTLTVDPEGVGPRAGLAAWTAADLPDPGPEASRELEAFARRFRSQGRSAWEQPPRTDPGELRRKLGIPPHARLLFLAAQVGRDTNTLLFSPQFADNSAWLDYLQSACRDLEDLYILVKPHPKDSASQTRLAARLGPRCRWAPQLHVHDALAACDSVACINSGVGLEAMLFDRDLVAGGRAFWTGKGLSLDIVQAEAQRRELRAFLASPPCGREAMARRRRAFLARFLAEAVYGGASDSGWLGIAALAERLAGLTVAGGSPTPAEREAWRGAPDWMARTETEALSDWEKSALAAGRELNCPSRQLPATELATGQRHALARRLLPYFD